MARVSLDLGRAHRGDLPPVCICCGIEATEYRDKMFSLSPFGIPLFIFPAWVAILPGRVWVRAPFCESHKNYWRRRLARIVGGLILAILPGIVGFPILIDATNRDIARLGAGLCLVSWIALLAWIVLTVWIQWRGIRLTQVTPILITLSNVSDAFAKAVKIGQELPECQGHR
jgi:hypothetical protein